MFRHTINKINSLRILIARNYFTSRARNFVFSTLNFPCLYLIFLIVFIWCGLCATEAFATNIKVEKKYCQIVFPEAEYISKKFENPSHYKVYKIDTDTNEKKLIGIAFLTTDLAPEIYGYSGRIKIMAGVDLSGSITGIHIISHSETLSFIKNIDRFINQFIGKNINDSFILGNDIDGLTRATITSKAIVDAIRKSLAPIKKQVLNIETQPSKKIINKIPLDKIIIPILIFSSAVTAVLLQNLILQKATMFFSLAYFGILTGAMLSASYVADVCLLKLPSFQYNPLWYMLFFPALITTLLFGKIYCRTICPFGSIQEIIFTFSKKWIKPKKLPKALNQKAQYTKYFILLILISSCIILKKSDIAAVEPYLTLFSFAASPLGWGLLIITLIASSFYFRFWCRFFCPTGAFLKLVSKLKFSRITLSKKNEKRN